MMTPFPISLRSSRTRALGTRQNDRIFASGSFGVKGCPGGGSVTGIPCLARSIHSTSRRGSKRLGNREELEWGGGPSTPGRADPLGRHHPAPGAPPPSARPRRRPPAVRSNPWARETSGSVRSRSRSTRAPWGCPGGSRRMGRGRARVPKRRPPKRAGPGGSSVGWARRRCSRSGPRRATWRACATCRSRGGCRP